MTAIHTPAGAEPPLGVGVRLETLAVMLLVWLAAVSFALLAGMALQRADHPGYDFRYFWLAGQLWADGISPYGPIFPETGARLVTEGHVPKIWPYPPSLWFLTVGLGSFSLKAAWAIWLGLCLASLAAASALVGFGLPARLLPRVAARPHLVRLGLFAAHLTLVAAMEATQLAIYSGQSTPFVYLGFAVLVVALARGWRVLAVAGLVVVCLKPQIGALVAIGLVICNRQGLGIVLAAALATALLIVPPMVTKPDVLLDWLSTLGAYDGVTLANQAVSMTGIRHLVWVAAHVDIGNLPAMAIALLAGTSVALYVRATAVRRCVLPAERSVEAAISATLVALAFAPLHIYDFLIIGIGGLVILRTRGPLLVAAAIAVAFVLRPSDIFLAIYGGAEFTLFPGSTFATVSALVLLILAVIGRSRTSA